MTPPDVWWRYVAPADDTIVARVVDAARDSLLSVLSVHTACPGTRRTEIACNAEGQVGFPGVSFEAAAGEAYLIRVSGDQVTGPFLLEIDLGGVVSGTVTVGATGEPLASARLSIRDESGERVAAATTDDAGEYATAVLAGTYFAIASRGGYLAEVYDEIPCPETSLECDLDSATPIEVASGATVSGIDFTLDPGGAIAGTVRDAVDGNPVNGADVHVWSTDGRRVGTAVTAGAGVYSVSRLPAGTYFAATEASGHRDELYDDVPCSGGPFAGCELESGTPIAVTAGATTEGVDFDLDRLGAVAGTVVAATGGEPLVGVEIDVRRVGGDTLFARGRTDAAGAYVAGGLEPGAYVVQTQLVSGFIAELYDDVPCPRFLGCLDDGTPVDVAVNTVTRGVDFRLSRPGLITGTVTEEATGEPIAGIGLDVFDARGGFPVSGLTDAEGRYAVETFSGVYFARTSNRAGYFDELYDDIPCGRGAAFSCLPSEGTPIGVTLEMTTAGIDFALAVSGSLSGRITDRATGQGIPFVDVQVWDEDGNPVESGSTDADGAYSVINLVPGTYFATTVSRGEYFDELYDGLPCPDGACDPTAGTPIAVELAATTTGVDFTLAGACRETLTALCLRGGRFRVETAWEDPAGNRGAGHPAMLTADSGFFWFFSPENVELVVKLLDGCFEPFDSFWFFGAGLTNVKVDVTVTDVLSGAVKRYRNSLGTAFEPILDTAAFATCETAAVPRPAPPRVRVPPAGVKGPSCTPGATGLCLSDGRFLVESFWRTPQGRTGEGRAVVLTGDTGFFWFFGPDNIEVVVKVLDACEIEPFNTFWVFAAGLTNVAVTLRVTDTVSGTVREYENPLGRSYRPLLDTSAFATCPGS